jgi:hypothetical protein
MMSEEPERIPQEHSQLVPPSHLTPIPVGAGTPDPAPEPRRPVSARELGMLIRQRLADILDATDAALAAFVGELKSKRGEHKGRG